MSDRAITYHIQTRMPTSYNRQLQPTFQRSAVSLWANRFRLYVFFREGRQAYRQTDGWTGEAGGRTDGQTDKNTDQKDRQIEIQTDRRKDRQADERTNRQTDTHTHRQRNIQTNRQTHRLIHRHT
ncbi:hypothetical protein DPMN_112486 [Dreissena polymorpha]|uniref:Uncharacterized protein n=1 Tax=Dreissena polymorpha TaxID=45954 RepID=A0A9D4KGI0_DREPO|nr:hypothetical protein DPMN_112486 [Dreissena polymorpha]